MSKLIVLALKVDYILATKNKDKGKESKKVKN